MQTETVQHTPGPWRTQKITQRPDPRDEYIGIRTDDEMIAKLVPWDTIPTSEAEANARLIAAAPDLLAALEAVLSAERECTAFPETHDDARLIIGRLAAIADRAIAKARGA